jgi:hypothetical protein
MKKSLGLSLAAATLLAGNAMAMDMGPGELTGDVRALYITESGNVDENALGLGLNPTYSQEVGGGLSFEVGVGVGVPAMESNDAVAGNFYVGNLSDDGTESETYSVITKANVTYDMGSAFVKAGYQELDTPLAGTDDIRLTPNTHMAVVAGYTGVENLTIVAAQVMQMQGWDSTEGFEYVAMSDAALGEAVDDKGVTAVGAVYSAEGEMSPNGQLWYYSMPDAKDGTVGAVSAMYLDVGASFGPAAVSAQYVTQDDDRGATTSIGLNAEIGVAEGVGIIAAYNTFDSDYKAAPAYYTWGGYPEYAVADELWANSANWDGGNAMKVAAAYSGIENLEVAAGYVSFSDVGSGIDVIASYQVSEQVAAGLVYETVTLEDDYKTANSVDDYSLMKVSASYTF